MLKLLHFQVIQKVVRLCDLLDMDLVCCVKLKLFPFLYSGKYYPNFCFVVCMKNTQQFCICIYLEPISGTSPKVPTSVKSWNTMSIEKLALAMLCPAQAYPVPLFRFVNMHMFLYLACNIFLIEYKYTKKLKFWT